jgi:cytochrome P450
MYKINSFIKESQRLHPLDLCKPTSLVECSQINPFSVFMQRAARQDHTFSDGTTVPRGTTLVVSAYPIHTDETIYPDALNFDPFRFVKLKEQDTSGRRFDMATTSAESLAFGHGRHACPGRYFAACELKLMLAHLVMNYDMKLENDGVRPADMWVAANCVPNPNAKVLFRRRID